MYLGVENPFAGMLRFDSAHLPGSVARCLEVMAGRADAQETALFARQLEYIYTQTFDILYPDLKARKLIPVDTRVPSGADGFTYTQYDKLGEARIVHNYAQDFPNADVVGKQFKQAIVSLGDSYQYTYQDMRAAAMAGVPLEARKAEAARYAMEVKLEQLAATGDTSTGLVGLANAPNILATTKVSQNNAGSTTGSGTDWPSLIKDALAKGNITAAAQEISKDVEALEQNIFTTSQGIFTPDTLVLPTSLYGLLATTKIAPQFGDTKSLLDWVVDSSPWLKNVDFWPRLNTAGASSFGRVMCYPKDPKVLSLIISQEFEQFAPQPRNMALIVPCHMRTGAVEVRYPIGVAYMDGCSRTGT